MAIVDWGDGLTGRTRSFLVAAVVVLLVGNAAALAAYDGATDNAPETSALADLDAYQRSLLHGAGQGAEQAPGGGPALAPGTGVGPGGKAPSSSNSAGSPASPEGTTTTTLPPYTYEVTLEPTCVAAGEDFTVTVKVEPSVAVGVIASHADGQSHSTRWGTTSGPEGTVVHTWQAPPIPGPGKLLVGALTSDGRLGGLMIDFRIVEVPGTC